MKQLIGIILIPFLLFTVSGAFAQAPDIDEATLRSWIQAMKKAPRGPFKQIRWFCRDGTIKPPKEYACKDHGGGVQHGEWTDRVKTLRENGYYIANVFASIDPQKFLQEPQHPEIIKQMILEQFLIHADDGWIFRRARYYRGALQAEDETRNGRALLLALIAEPLWKEKYFVLREAVRLFPHGRRGAPISEMRQLSLEIAEKDETFESLRIKIHVKPELSDARRVRTYAAEKGRPELSADYEQLAEIIENVFKPSDPGAELLRLSKQIKGKKIIRLLRQRSGQLSNDNSPWIRFAAACRLMATLRKEFSGGAGEKQLLAYLDASLMLEDDLFRSSNDLLAGLNQASLKQRLMWLKETTSALFGKGLLSPRQWQALQDNIDGLTQSSHLILADYKSGLEYAALVPGWSDRAIRFHFSESVELFSMIEPIAGRYVHDRLRGSLLLFYAAVLDSMLADANLKSGIQTNLFGQQHASGLRGLNAGLSRGVLHVVRKGAPTAKFEPNGIYVLPATTEDLPPVAGIITAGKGNILSHVQLLARNLGIPNVAVDKKLLPQISSREGRKVVLAVSPEGIVQLVDDSPQWDEIFDDENKSQQILIWPDLEKLDLYNHSFIPLHNIRAADSGRVAGPKAANLGELKHFFPQAVTDGLVIPFGVFRSFLDQPIEPGGPSVFEWMQAQYAFIRSLENNPEQQEATTRRFLTRMRDWIVNADTGPEFRERLRTSMENAFGPDGTYGVFVRSDTNVEDLPGFTGAGLNLTMANVVGFENVLKAIQKVWASPFTERAYQWRQAYMDHPENVYASVLLLKSIPAEKSGVMVTVDVTSGNPDWLTVAVNEGVGGAVSGQTAEELRVHMASGRVRLMAQATEPRKRILLETGGVAKIAAKGGEAVLSDNDIELLINFARSVPQRFPKLLGADGQPVPADIEFGFYRNQLVLFQIRPFLDSIRARQNLFLNRLDQTLKEKHALAVNLDTLIGE